MNIEFPVIVDYLAASTPRGEIAMRLLAEAQEQNEKLLGADKKAGTLRILANGRSDLFNMNPYLVKIKPDWNSRAINDPANVEHIDNLARSIAVNGVRQPLTVTLDGNDVFVTDGHCRLLATFRAIEVYGAEIKSIQLVPESRHANDAERVLSQITRNAGKPLTVLEQGAVFVKLLGFGWTTSQIAEKVGLGKLRVEQILDLIADANDGIKGLVASGQVSATTAATELRNAGGDAAAAETVLKAAVVVAKAHGKSKATARDVTAAAGDGVKLSTKLQLKAIFEARSTKIDDTGKGGADIHLSGPNWERLKTLLKL